MNNNIIFSICARGGSKGLPNKNISDFMGRPLITTTIEQARKSKYCNDIYVSTDSHKILEVAKKAGCSNSELMHSGKELPMEKIKNSKNIGISSGASAPEQLVQDLISEIKKYCKVSLEEVVVAEEKVKFKLPKDLN